MPLVEITLQGNPQLQVTGGRGAPITLNYRTDFVAASYRAQPRIDVRDSEVVFVGYGINAPERGWNDYAGLDVRGRTVIILVNDADWNAAGSEGVFGGRGMTYYGRWTYKFEEAARQGAAAALIVHDTAPGLLWLERRREQLDRAAALHALGRRRREPDGDERLAHQRGGAAAARGGGAGSRRADPGGAAARLPAGAARACG